MKEFGVANIKKKPKKVDTTDIEEYLEQIPPPPQEHAYELKMERRLKHMLEEQEKKKTKKRTFPKISVDTRDRFASFTNLHIQSICLKISACCHS